MSGSTLVSIVVLNWNGSRYIRHCLDSALRQTYPCVEILLVDNGSSDGSWEAILEEYAGRIQFHRNERNLGFAEGMNTGISRARGGYIIPLNLDVVLREDFVERCVEEMARHPEAGCVGGKELSWIGDEFTSRVVSEGGFFLKRRIQGVTNVRKGDGYCFGPHGSFPFIRKEALDGVFRVNGYHYDSKFETGWEDMDLWFRMHLLGWRCRYTDRAVAWHVGSASADRKNTFLSKSIDYQKRILRNRYFLMLKNLPLSLALSLLPSILLGELALMPYLALHSPRAMLARLHALGDLARQYPSVLADHRRMAAARIADPRELRRFFVCF